MTVLLRMKKHFGFLILLSIVLSLFTALNSHMNNWLIFRSSFFHLLDGVSLYQLYPEEHKDLFKYSPTFAMLIAPLSLLPPVAGAVAWNLLGCALFIYAIIRLPITDSARKGIFWISVPEFIGSTQGFQSNIHMVALLALAWVYLEEQKSWKMASNLLASFFIKIFGILGLTLFIFDEYSLKRPARFGGHLIALIILGSLFTLLPTLVVGWDGLVFQYKEWGQLLKNDVTAAYGFSLMGIFHAFSGLEFDRLPWQVAGGLTILVSFFCFRKGDQLSRLMGLVSLCYFMILFNHKSESPTFIIAMLAFGIHQAFIKNQKLRWSLIAFTLFCVSVLYADPFRGFRTPLDFYAVKAWPFVFLYPLALCQWGLDKNLALSKKN